MLARARRLESPPLGSDLRGIVAKRDPNHAQASIQRRPRSRKCVAEKRSCRAAHAAEATPRTRRPIYIGGWHEAPIYEFADLAAGQRITRPALVESETTSVLLRPGDRAVTTGQGWLDIEVPDGETA